MICVCCFFFFKQKTAYEMRISDWSSDVCSSDLLLDDKGNITERRLRGYASDTAQKIGYTYDDLDRVTHKNLPGSELDIDYAYDNLGRLTAANQTSGANDLTFTYDALGRNLTQIGRASCRERVCQYV